VEALQPKIHNFFKKVFELPSPCDAAIGAPARPITGLFAKVPYEVYTLVSPSRTHTHTKRDDNYLKMQRYRQKRYIKVHVYWVENAVKLTYEYL
jgi:hypothetical protein